LFTSQPKSATPAPFVGIAVGAPNLRDQAGAITVADDTSDPEETLAYGPALICPGMTFMGLRVTRNVAPPLKGYVRPDRGVVN
jgi:hypothetical protein